MHAAASDTDDRRAEAARLAFALLRFEAPAAHLSRASTPSRALQIGTQAYTFIPSWEIIPNDEVEAFLVGLPSPALLAPTTMRGSIALLLLHELSGDRRRWAEKTFSNYADVLEELVQQLGLSPHSRVLVEFDAESHVFSLATLRECSRQFAVHVGWNLGPLPDEPRADALLGLLRGDGQWYHGRSCWVPRTRPRQEPESGPG
jgi:hypothetical protein